MGMISQAILLLRTRKFKISIIPQFGGLFSSLSAEENMRAVGEIIVKDK